MSTLRSNNRASFSPEDNQIIEEFCTHNPTFQAFLADATPTITNLRNYECGLDELYAMFGLEYNELDGIVNREGQRVLPMLNNKVISKIARTCDSLKARPAGLRSKSTTPDLDQRRTTSINTTYVVKNYPGLA